VFGLSERQKEFLAALALWKIDRLLGAPFRYRSGCHLELESLKLGKPTLTLDGRAAEDARQSVKIKVDIAEAIKNAAFRTKDDGTPDDSPLVTDVYWPHDKLYREAEDNKSGSARDNNVEDDASDENGNGDGEDA